MMDSRPVFPKRAVVTGGMPYGNKPLHFGHIGSVFILADVFARFMRDRIGEENVIFVSGIDCYGSMVLTAHEQLIESGEFTGSLEDFVKSNYEIQKRALDDFQIGLTMYAASSFGDAAPVHEKMSEYFFTKLYEKGFLKKINAMQFYDNKKGVFLNGRQVAGACPIEGCRSESAYADECSLGHQFNPSELIDPISVLSNERPAMKEAGNWYFKLDEFNGLLREWVDSIKKSGAKPYLIRVAEEFLKKPVIYIKKNQQTRFDEIKSLLPPFAPEDDNSKASFVLVFDELNSRERACEILTENGVRFRTGKTLVPFRLTANTDWGIKAPEVEGLGGLTFWVWPESLWAPISFTQTVLQAKDENAAPDAWKEWWARRDSRVFQFIGEDNIYFYGPAEMAMFMSMNDGEPESDPGDGQLQLPYINSSCHSLFFGKKAGSSSELKPPSAFELLEHYTPEQIRACFMGLSQNYRSVNFQPKPFNPEADPNEPDPVLKEGSLLTNVFNRLIRSCFYSAQKYSENRVPVKEIGEEIINKSNETILEYERLMYNCEFHQVMYLLDSYCRFANKYWVKNIKEADDSNDDEKRLQTIADCFHAVRVLTVLFHPIVPAATENIRAYFNADERFFNWEYIFETIYFFIGAHELKFLQPREDFFVKHESQLKDVSK